jgi:hypothetical protein
MTHSTFLQSQALWRNKHNYLTTMRKGLLLACFFFLLTSTYAQMTVVIASQNGNEICAGFTPANCAHIAVVTPPPLPVSTNSILVYTWTAEHANGSWTWHTNYPTRVIPLPFPGQYRIQVKIEYMRRGTKRPYAAFWSNKLYVQGMNCP